MLLVRTESSKSYRCGVSVHTYYIYMFPSRIFFFIPRGNVLGLSLTGNLLADELYVLLNAVPASSNDCSSRHLSLSRISFTVFLRLLEPG